MKLAYFYPLVLLPMFIMLGRSTGPGGTGNNENVFIIIFAIFATITISVMEKVSHADAMKKAGISIILIVTIAYLGSELAYLPWCQNEKQAFDSSWFGEKMFGFATVECAHKFVIPYGLIGGLICIVAACMK